MKPKTILTLGLAALTAFPALGEMMRVSTADALRNAVTKVQPEYPPMAKQMKVTGKVELEVQITPDGTVDAVRAISGNALLSSSASNAVKRWKFTPFQENGTPSKAVAVLSFDFKQ